MISQGYKHFTAEGWDWINTMFCQSQQWSNNYVWRYKFQTSKTSKNIWQCRWWILSKNFYREHCRKVYIVNVPSLRVKSFYFSKRRIKKSVTEQTRSRKTVFKLFLSKTLPPWRLKLSSISQSKIKKWSTNRKGLTYIFIII